jgi:hypothetical protein
LCRLTRFVFFPPSSPSFISLSLYAPSGSDIDSLRCFDSKQTALDKLKVFFATGGAAKERAQAAVAASAA